LTESPSFVDWIGDVETPLRYDNVASLSPALVKWLVKLCMAGFAALVVWRCRAPFDERRGRRAAGEAAVILLGMLLFRARTWEHHAVTLMLPFAVFAHVATTAGERRRRLVAGGVLAASLLLIVLPGLAGGKDRAEAGASPGAGKLALAYGAYTLAFLTLL